MGVSSSGGAFVCVWHVSAVGVVSVTSVVQLVLREKGNEGEW